VQKGARLPVAHASICREHSSSHTFHRTQMAHRNAESCEAMDHLPAAFAGFAGGALGQKRHERIAHLAAQRTEEEARLLVEALLIARRLVFVQRLRVAVEARDMYVVPTGLKMQIAAAIQSLRHANPHPRPTQPTPRAERFSCFVTVVCQERGALYQTHQAHGAVFRRRRRLGAYDTLQLLLRLLFVLLLFFFLRVRQHRVGKELLLRREAREQRLLAPAPETASAGQVWAQQHGSTNTQGNTCATLIHW